MKKLFFSLMAAVSLFAEPQAIVFDFGGVMTTEFFRQVVVDFLQDSFQLSEEEFERANLEKKRAIKAGKTDKEFWLAFAKAKGIDLPSNWADELDAIMAKALNVNPEMYALVAQLKEKGIPVGLLSNVDERLGKLVGQFGFYEPFSPCLLSYEIGVRKPDPKAYTILLETLHLPATDIIFIDDRSENVEQAKALGIDAILFESPEQLRNELKKREL